MNSCLFGSGTAVGVAKAKVAVLEDEQVDVTKIEIALHEYGTDLQISMDYQNFVQRVKTQKFDAVSIDWYVNKHEKGVEALQLLSREQPEAARVVFTQHADRIDVARSLKADFCLLKSDFVNFVPTMETAVRLGRARRIVNRLKCLGESSLPTLVDGQLFDERFEEQVRSRAREVLRVRALREERDKELSDLVITRGWWTKFEPATYAKQPFIAKLTYLAQWAGATPDDLAQILGVERSVMDAVVQRADGGSEMDRKFWESVDYLLSVLGYVLTLSGYDVELMSHYWNVQELQLSCSNPPPWNELGLAAYVRHFGPKGLYRCVSWIRSN